MWSAQFWIQRKTLETRTVGRRMLMLTLLTAKLRLSQKRSKRSSHGSQRGKRTREQNLPNPVRQSPPYPPPPLQSGKGAYREVVMRAVKSPEEDSRGRNRPSSGKLEAEWGAAIIELSRSSKPSRYPTPLTQPVEIKLREDRSPPPGKSKRSVRAGKG